MYDGSTASEAFSHSAASENKQALQTPKMTVLWTTPDKKAEQPPPGFHTLSINTQRHWRGCSLVCSHPA